MECPICFLQNDLGTARCSCGYNFHRPDGGCSTTGVLEGPVAQSDLSSQDEKVGPIDQGLNGMAIGYVVVHLVMSPVVAIVALQFPDASGEASLAQDILSILALPGVLILGFLSAFTYRWFARCKGLFVSTVFLVSSVVLTSAIGVALSFGFVFLIAQIMNLLIPVPGP